MRKTYIFAIGGTGARVLRSLTMLMASGVKGMDGTICPIIIDYDEKNGDKIRAITCMRKYSEIQKLVKNGKAKIDNELIKSGNLSYSSFFTAEYEEMLINWSWGFNVKNDQKLKYCDYISYNNIANYSVTTQKLMDCLYDTNNNSVYSELNLNMTEGFQGNPNIGSVVFDELKNCDEFKTFKNDFRKDDRIVIIGSIFGGTGSSGIPKIVAAIRDKENNKTDVTTADISVVLVLPYFSVDNPNQGEISIKSNIFNSKTKAALNYYETSGLNDQINRIYYVGDKQPTKVEPHIGNEEQKNKAHIVELIAAMSVAHNITNESQSARGVKYKFSSCLDINDGIGLKELIGDSNQWSSNVFVRDILHNMINFVFAMRYYLDNIVNTANRMNQRSFYKELHLDFEDKKMKSDGVSIIQDYCAVLFDFLCKKDNLVNNDDGFWPWMKELHDAVHGPHRLNIFDLDSVHIVDLLNGYNFRTEPTTVLGLKVNSKKPLMEYEDAFDSEMGNNLVPYRKGQKKLEELDKSAYPWVFNDLLTKMPECIRKFDNKLEDRFTLVP